eukprot:CAMPEP_0177791066 /NCGR_PEP_ID=MMETSP0491_2-20121128/23719_1 /TAXON_ID=63592 /ORGANISM="Tetraselmis chuii, Strain PLY429" /LENGTH=52 /DNA_ID=CAMNT_0019313241 /DNA_START=12 /DNA_END=166 /DNA_ORIENTATION=+
MEASRSSAFQTAQQAKSELAAMRQRLRPGVEQKSQAAAAEKSAKLQQPQELT